MSQQPETGTTASPWHGWARVRDRGSTGFTTYGRLLKALYIGPYPRRKAIALYVQEGATSEPLAYFVSEEAARRALEFLDQLTG